MKNIEVIRQPHQTLFFVVIRNVVYFTTCFGQRGHLQVIHNMYEIHVTEGLLQYTSSSNSMFCRIPSDIIIEICVIEECYKEHRPCY